jgi:hypothetical protein
MIEILSCTQQFMSSVTLSVLKRVIPRNLIGWNSIFWVWPNRYTCMIPPNPSIRPIRVTSLNSLKLRDYFHRSNQELTDKPLTFPFNVIRQTSSYNDIPVGPALVNGVLKTFLNPSRREDALFSHLDNMTEFRQNLKT